MSFFDPNALQQPGRLPTPPHWHALPATGLRMLFPVLSAILAVIGAVALAAAGGGFAVVTLLLPLWLAAMVAGGVLLKRRQELKATWNEYGCTLYLDRTKSKLFLLSFGLVCSLGLVYAVLVFAGVDMPPLFASFGTRRHHHAATASSPEHDAVFAASFGIIMIVALIWIWRRFAGAYLNLSPTGFYANEIPVKEGNWDDVLDVLDFIPWADPSIPPMSEPPPRPIVFVMRDRSLRILPTGSAYAPNGPALFWMIRNYWQRPEERVELTNGVAVTRLEREEFPYS